MQFQLFCHVCLTCCLVLGTFCHRCTASDQDKLDFFETKIRPVLVEHCYRCHAADAKIIRGGLLLDSRQATLDGGDSGPGVVPGVPEESLLLAAIKHEGYEMPPDRKLPESVIADFERWVLDGALDPRDVGRGDAPLGLDWQAAASHWAFQRLTPVDPPVVQDDTWVQSPIDRFILSKLEENGFTPPPRADKRVLIRRATYDLTGLPPTAEQITAFLQDDSPDSFQRLIDSLLSSPQYGERWGRHWMDLVRYADTNGADENHALPVAWRYRDWIIEMLNRDLPWDQFLMHQLAGDLLTGDTATGPDHERRAGERLTATGMLVVGPKMLAEQDKEKMLIDIVDEQVDTVSRTMLGLTIACARCHDHKFDPISAEDYYALAGIFVSTKTMADRAFVSKWLERPLPDAKRSSQRQQHQIRIDALRMKEQAVAAEVKQNDQDADLQQKHAELREQLKKLEEAMPAYATVMAVQEDSPTDVPVHIRGNHLALGKESVARGLPQILADVDSLETIPENQSGRLQLARWLVSPNNPLTSRVMANRLWMWHFGQALQRSPSNFGLMGQEPTHPELLDFLAQQWFQQGWSIKQMHRMIMRSSTYQMASVPDHPDTLKYVQRDPENRLWWRRDRRRLEAEAVRDSVLAAGGELDLRMGGPGQGADSHRRAVYLTINRAGLYEMFSTFDYVETANHIEQRPTTLVPHQALFLLNSPLVLKSSERLAEQAAREFPDPQARITALFENLLGIQPDDQQFRRTHAFLHDLGSPASQKGEAPDLDQAAWQALCRALLATNDFLYIP